MPRILTNKHDLPEPLYNACKNDDHEVHGDISVTQLVDSPRIAKLKRENEYTEDVIDMMWAVLGSGVHNVLEKSVIPNAEARKMIETASILKAKGSERDQKAADYLISKAYEWYPEELDSRYDVEKYVTMEVDGVTISGKFDLFDHETGMLQDYKITSAWTYVFQDARKKHVAQQNVYAYMLKQLGYEVKGAQLIGFFKDHKRGQVGKGDYPPNPIEPIDVPIYDEDKILEYIRSRVKAHKDTWNGKDHRCTDEEVWKDKDSWAVMAAGRSRALRVFQEGQHKDAKAVAEEYITENEHKFTNDLMIVKRPGRHKRCEEFCPVAEFCDQYKEYLEEMEKASSQESKMKEK